MGLNPANGGQSMRWMSWVKLAVGASLAMAGLACLPAALEACTRCVYLGPKDTVVVAKQLLQY